MSSEAKPDRSSADGDSSPNSEADDVVVVNREEEAGVNQERDSAKEDHVSENEEKAEGGDDNPTIPSNEVNVDDIEARKKERYYRLAGRPPLKTMLILAVGPVMAQVAASLYGVVDTMWVSRAVGTIGITAISTYAPFDGIARAFGFFCNVSGSSRISSLFGQGREQEASQVLCDIIRVALICGAGVVSVFTPCMKMAARWFGASEEVVEMGFEYIVVLLAMSWSTCLYYAVGGFLQGEGRSMLFGFLNVGSMFLNMVALDPLFLFGIKMGVRGAALATVLAEFFPAMGIIFGYFRGWFTVKPKLVQLIRPFSHETRQALRIGGSQLVAQLAITAPGILVTYLIGQSTKTPEEYNGAIAGNNVTFRIAMVVMSVIIAVNMGFIPAGSYAYASGNYKRWLKLFFHAAWINFAWGSLCGVLILSMPRYVAMLFASDDEFLDYAAPMLTYGNSLAFISWIKNNAQSCLQSLQKGMLATALAIVTQLLFLVGSALMLFYTDRYNPRRLQWSYPMSFGLGIFISVPVIIVQVLKVRKLIEAQEKQEGSALASISSEEAKENEVIEEVVDDRASDAAT